MILGNQPVQQPTPDEGLITLIAKAHHYINKLTAGDGTTIADLADSEHLDVSDLSRILRLAYLAPDITTAILEGTHPVELTSSHLMRAGDIPFDWHDQRRGSDSFG